LPFLARLAVIDVDDCLDEVMINQSVLKFREIPYCNYNRPLELQLPSTLVASTLFPLQERWSVSLRFTNRGGPGKIYFRLKPAAKVELFLRVFQLIFATTFFFLLAWQFRKNKLSILELYNSHVEWFEKKRNPNLMEKKYLDALIVQMPAKGKILDLGCGIGTPIARYFSQNNFQVTGVDGAEKMIHKARQLAPDGRWIVADMRSLSLGEAFDAIVAWDSFFHLTHEEQRQMFAIFKNHLNPGGILLFTSGPAEGVAIGEMNGHELFHSSLSSEEYKKLLIQNGLEVIDHQIEDPECGYHTVWLARILTHKS
jgi:SAM-dependent methyltransferase